MSGHAEGGWIEPRRHVEGEIPIRLSDPVSVVPSAMVLKYGREYLRALQGGGEVYTAEEVLAAYDDLDEGDE